MEMEMCRCSLVYDVIKCSIKVVTSFMNVQGLNEIMEMLQRKINTMHKYFSYWWRRR